MTIQEVEVKGLRELREALLRKIPSEMRGKVLQQALSAGARPIMQSARALAPVKTGRLKKAIYSTRVKATSNGVFEERAVTVRKGKKFQKSGRDAYYWKFIEFGHRTGAAKGNYLRKAGRQSHGSAVEAKGFVPARPFMRPAFDAQKTHALSEIVKKLGIAIEKAANKAAWRTPR